MLLCIFNEPKGMLKSWMYKKLNLLRWKSGFLISLRMFFFTQLSLVFSYFLGKLYMLNTIFKVKDF